MTLASPEKFRECLGFLPEAVTELPDGFARTLVRHDRFREIVAHWESLPAGALPALRGILPSASEKSRLLLNLLLEIPGESRILCLEVDVPRDRTLPDLRPLWPSAEWWQEELAVFHGARFEGSRGKCADMPSPRALDGGTRWRQA